MSARRRPKLKEFFGGQQLTSGSSGWLATAYTRRGTVDALINYESVLLSLNRDSHTGLTVIRPRDGVVTADYPLSLLSAASPDAKDAVRALTSYLRSPAAQRQLTRETFRRPVVASVTAGGAAGRRGPSGTPVPRLAIRRGRAARQLREQAPAALAHRVRAGHVRVDAGRAATEAEGGARPG